MRCYRARRWLSAHLDDELDPRRREALEAHLESCETCSAELERQETLSAGLAQGDQTPPLPAEMWGQVLAALDEAERLPWHRRLRPRLLQAACVAACVALGFVGGAHLSWRHSAVDHHPSSVATSERVMVAEAFDVTAFGLGEGEEGLLQCDHK